MPLYCILKSGKIDTWWNIYLIINHNYSVICLCRMIFSTSFEHLGQKSITWGNTFWGAKSTWSKKMHLKKLFFFWFFLHLFTSISNDNCSVICLCRTILNMSFGHLGQKSIQIWFRICILIFGRLWKPWTNIYSNMVLDFDFDFWKVPKLDFKKLFEVFLHWLQTRISARYAGLILAPAEGMWPPAT